MSGYDRERKAQTNGFKFNSLTLGVVRKTLNKSNITQHQHEPYVGENVKAFLKFLTKAMVILKTELYL